MDVTILQDARRAPMTFLYATERRFRSSTESSWSADATFFMFSTISKTVRIDETRIGGRSERRTFITLSLLSQFGQIDIIFVTHRDCREC